MNSHPTDSDSPESNPGPPSTADTSWEAIEAANAELRGSTSREHGRAAGRQSTRGGAIASRWTGDWVDESSDPVPSGIAKQVLSPDVLARLRLSLVPGVGPRVMAALLERFGDAAGVLKAPSESLAAVPGVGPKLVAQVKLAPRHDELDGLVHWCQRHDTDLLVCGRDGYPAMLDDLWDAPPLLFCRGEILPVDSMAVAIVGTRHATPYGLRQAEQLAYGLARAGVTIVSGLARGIDAAAHQGALDAGGRTIAVLGGGLAEMYPAEHGGLAKAISADGAVLSEQAPTVKPRGPLFPQRNRIVASLAIATLVVEAPQRSGSLITARLAGEMNRDVLALPGPVTSRASRGCNELIRDGATLVQNVDDILEVLGPMRAPVETEPGLAIHRPGELKLNDVERAVLGAVGTQSTSIDQVIQSSELPAHRVMSVISILEMRRLVRRISGQYVIRV